jgi:hypothetical protein
MARSTLILLRFRQLKANFIIIRPFVLIADRSDASRSAVKAFLKRVSACIQAKIFDTQQINASPGEQSRDAA